MATDGVKIIDGDTAHDTYWGIMDLYDGGATIEAIIQKFPLGPSPYTDDFNHEIYVTSWALAMWEIGQMTEDKLAYTKIIINQGAGVRVWTEEAGPKAGKARQKELDKLWIKISRPNTRIRARKKYRKIKNLYFQPDDLLTFQLRDGAYKVVICAYINQYRGHCDYVLIPTTYSSGKKPTVDDLKSGAILGIQIDTGYNQQTTRELQPGIERIWEWTGGNCNFFFGLDQLLVGHKDFAGFKDKFEKIGTLKIAPGLKQSGARRSAADFEQFETVFGDLENYINTFRCKKYPVVILCDV